MNGDRPGVLLLGASGFFGPALVQQFGSAVLAKTYVSHPIPHGTRFDARESSVAALVGSLPARPQAAIVMLGETNIDRCARDPDGTSAVNVGAVTRVIGELVALQITPVFLSSDGVLDGRRSFTSESDAPKPILTYGRQKLEVEQFMASLPRPWMIARLPKLLSIAADPRCMLTQWIGALDRGERIRCAVDQFFTPAAAVDAATAIASLVQKRAQGLYHVAGPQRLSRRELLQAVQDEYRQFAQSTAPIEECSLRDIEVLEPRPLDTSLSIDRLRQAVGIPMRPPSEVARAAVRQHFGGSAGR